MRGIGRLKILWRKARILHDANAIDETSVSRRYRKSFGYFGYWEAKSAPA
jgi:hypothetical protein